MNSGRGRIFLLDTTSISILEPSESLVQYVAAFFFQGVQGLEPETDHSPPSGINGKNAWSFTSTLSHS
jgi:hypothetical protein